MDTFSTGKADVIGAYTISITIAADGQVPTTGVVINASGKIAGTYGQATYGGGAQGKLRAFLDLNGTVTTFDGGPGAQKTLVRGIDAAGDVIGVYVDGAGVAHGYVYRGGVSTPFDMPGATSTNITLVDAAGEFAGYYKDASGTHSFVDRSGTFVTILLPAGATGDAPTAIDAAGDVAGTYSDAAGKQQVYIDTAVGLRTIALPGNDGVSIFGVDPDGDVVGSYGGPVGAVYFRDTTMGGVQSITLPTPGSITGIVGIDTAGDVAGTYLDAATHLYRSFVTTAAGVSTTVDGPSGAAYASVTGIQPDGTLFGEYGDATGEHLFVERGSVATTVPQPNPGYVSSATGADAAGDVVGGYVSADAFQHSFVAPAGGAGASQITVSSAPPVRILSIDRAGDIIGTVDDADGLHVLVDRGGTITTVDGGPGAIGTDVAGVDAAGDLYGSYVDASFRGGSFTDIGGVVSPFQAASGALSTEIEAVNAAGDFAGDYRDSGNAAHSYVDIGGVVTSFDFPTPYADRILGMDGAGDVLAEDDVSTGQAYYVRMVDGTVSQVLVPDIRQVNGIDAAGDVFGVYASGSTFHAFIEPAGSSSYVSFDAPAGGTFPSISFIDAAGDAFGTYEDAVDDRVLFERKAGASASIAS